MQKKLWEQFGVVTECTTEGAYIRYDSEHVSESSIKFDFGAMPDLVMSFVVACCTRGIEFEFTGVETLYIKECDRVCALCDELKKLGYVLEANGGTLAWKGKRCEVTSSVSIQTYRDHRMAMAFAPYILSGEVHELKIENIEVVKKSFPTFWDCFAQNGITIYPIER